MSFLTGLGAAAGGASQGIDQGAQLRQRAQQLQMGQQALDQEKRRLAAEAMAFSNLGSVGGQQGGMAPQGGMPGQPMQPPPTALPVPPGQSSQPSVPGGTPPTGPGQPPSGGQQPAPPPQQGGGGPLPQQQAQQPGGPQDPSLDPMAGVKAVMQIAKEIKSRNPNIDPTTLFEATSRIIDMSKGMAPALRQQAAVVIQQMKDQTSQGNTAARVGATDRATEARTADTGARIDSQEKIAGGHDATRLQAVAQSGAQAMERVQANIQAAGDRAAKGLWSKEKAGAYSERMKAAGNKLKSATSTLTSLTNAGVKADDARVTKAQKDIDGATAEMDRVNKVAGADSGGGAQQPQQRGPSPASLHGKPIWPEGGKWVYEDGTEAK